MNLRWIRQIWMAKMKNESRPHRIWRFMIARCHDPNSKDWFRYGNRGIKVCARWRTSFDNFWTDMGLFYNDELQIERIDNDKGYHKKNCRWATPKENSRNKRNNTFILTQWGKITLAEAAERTGIPSPTIEWRIRKNWPDDKLLIPQVGFPRLSSRTKFIDTPWGKIPLFEASAKSGIGESLLRYRLRKRWPVYRLFAPADRSGPNG